MKPNDPTRQSMHTKAGSAAFRQAVVDEPALRAALAEADIVPQLMVQAQLSGDTDLLDRARPHVTGGWSYMQDIPAALAAEIRERLVRTLTARAAGPAPGAAADHDDLSPAMFSCVMGTGVGALVPDDYVSMMLEEVGAEKRDSRSVNWRRPVPESSRNAFHVLIVGAGMSGLCMGIKLREAGIPFTIIEKNDAVGGTWYENDYPGCAVDIPNHFYSFSFEPKSDWTRHFARRGELWKYLEHCADKYGIRPNIRFRTELVSARYDEAGALWHVTVRDAAGREEVLQGRAFVPGVGQLNRPAIPDIPGLADFGGPAFHTARWDHGVDLRGKRVAMIGTGASAMQAGPTIAPVVDRLTVFQRGRHWCLPHPLYHAEVSPGMQWACANIPYFGQWYRFQLFWASGDGLYSMLQVDPGWGSPELSLNAESHAFRERLLAHMRQELGDRPDLLAKAMPGYPPYGKRMLRDNGWYKMLKRPNVTLSDRGVARVEPGGIVDGDGVRHAIDLIVLATGFQATRMLADIEITGRGGVNLRELWGEDNPRAHLGITVPGFPNMFLMQGPNTILSHGGSMFFHTECQVRYAMQCIRELIEGGHAAMDCRLPVYEEFNRRVDEAHSRMVWTHRGVKNWYKNKDGRVTAVSPWRLVDYWRLTAALNPSDYRFLAAQPRATG